MDRQQPTPSDDNPPAFNAPPAVLAITAFLVLLFLSLRFGPQDWRYWVLENLALFPEHFWLAWHLGIFEAAAFWPLISHGLLHLDWLHLLVNAGFLLAFGSFCERLYGSVAFVFLFVFGVLAGALAHLFFSEPSEGLMIGASGAVYAYLGAATPFLFMASGSQSGRRAMTFAVILMVINIGISWANDLWDLFGASIAWRAHVGGFVFGIAYALVKKYQLRQFFRQD